MPQPTCIAQVRRATLFETLLTDFIARTGSRPPPFVYDCHPAYEPLEKAFAVAYRAIDAGDEGWARREASDDASRLLYYITRSATGSLVYDGQTAKELTLAEHRRELRQYYLRRRLKDRAVSRAFGDPASHRPFAHLVEPSQSEVFETVATALISDDPPKGANTGDLGKAYRLLRSAFLPDEANLIAQVAWGADGDTAMKDAAVQVFLEAFPTPPEDWMAAIKTTADRIRKETQMYLPPQKPRPSGGLKLVRVGQMEAKEPDYLIDGLIEKDCTVTIFGDPGCGKSFLSLDMAMCVASGTAFHGRTVKRGPVIYLAGEGHNGLVRRVEAWCKVKGIRKDDAHLRFSNKAPQLLRQSSMDELAAAISKAVEEEGLPSLVIVDTVARAFGGGDENSTKDMSAFIGALDTIRAKLGCTIILVHHSGHGDKQRARGSIALKGAVDVEFRVEKKGKTITVENHKMKGGPPPPIMHFQLDEVVLGRAKNGKDITSAVLRETDHFDEDRPKKLTNNQKLGLNTYEEAVRLHGTLRTDGTFAGVHVETWRETFYPKHTGDNIGAKKKAFQRTRDDLVAMGRLRVDDDVYFVAGDFPAIDEARFVDMIRKRDTGQ